MIEIDEQVIEAMGFEELAQLAAYIGIPTEHTTTFEKLKRAILANKI